MRTPRTPTRPHPKVPRARRLGESWLLSWNWFADSILLVQIWSWNHKSCLTVICTPENTMDMRLCKDWLVTGVLNVMLTLIPWQFGCKTNIFQDLSVDHEIYISFYIHLYRYPVSTYRGVLSNSKWELPSCSRFSSYLEGGWEQGKQLSFWWVKSAWASCLWKASWSHLISHTK